ncbi:MAG: tRNA (N6-isopentenyl adenosine(37)-C2)-methylthiotransferase MiaB [Candidatus Cloacimonetes bacterium]|jgi:tRNA-2-methylthio-N6-dimethylallyladenosine synthase|nr:tRNA (N6-isopentenyl adenosine(37)-C2)-methylthiotransferase MiaB [Candidatus Cloacimonadota bacterium]NLO44739.1 tRNA (N6-isopentenyl adenosine(37)-C2)-methylthiotransferase MiaB [Candidatus Cloacimonadota bacterium]
MKIKRKYYIETYGCQMNVSDSELIISVLDNDGYEQVDSIDDADIILFNTCSVREHAEQRVLGRVSNERHRKIQKPSLKIGLLGCMAQRIGERLVSDDLGIDFAVGVDQYHALPEILRETCGSELGFDSEQIYEGIIPKHQGEHCAFITIMRGCNNFCSYCIVPYVRGRERSRPYSDIKKDIEQALSSNMFDITLLGQNVNSYLFDGMAFPALLRQIEKDFEGIKRLRFITSHPKDLSDELIETMANSSILCNHIHLPMQSGDNKVLRRMNRSYSIEDYMLIVDKLRKAVPDIALTTDLIAGFPGESKEQFEATLSAMERIGFDYAFCFKYSPREGTEAANYENQVPESERLKRLQEMIELQRKITLDKYREMIGKEVEVYVEGFSKKSKEKVSGKSRDFKICVLSGDANDIGTIKRAKVLNATAGTLICE